MEKLDKFIGLQDNVSLSNLDRKSKIHFINLILEEPLIYRRNLNLNRKTTFGMEIEFECKNKRSVRFEEDLQKLLKQKGIVTTLYGEDKEESFSEHLITSDYSLNNGFEIATRVFNDSISNWLDFEKLVDELKKHFIIKDTCGGHVHIGIQSLGNNFFNNFLLLWSTYENILFRFAAGEYNNLRTRSYDHYSKPVYDSFDILRNSNPKIKKGILIYDEDDFDIENIILEKYNAVNLMHLRTHDDRNNLNTIEFRLSNGTLNKTIWQNLVNCYATKLEYSSNPNFDMDLVFKRKDKICKLNRTILYYRLVYLEQAFEFADLLFKTNEDKIYFLKQYLKDLKTDYTEKHDHDGYIISNTKLIKNLTR